MPRISGNLLGMLFFFLHLPTSRTEYLDIKFVRLDNWFCDDGKIIGNPRGSKTIHRLNSNTILVYKLGVRIW